MSDQSDLLLMLSGEAWEEVRTHIRMTITSLSQTNPGTTIGLHLCNQRGNSLMHIHDGVDSEIGQAKAAQGVACKLRSMPGRHTLTEEREYGPVVAIQFASGVIGAISGLSPEAASTLLGELRDKGNL